MVFEGKSDSAATVPSQKERNSSSKNMDDTLKTFSTASEKKKITDKDTRTMPFVPKEKPQHRDVTQYRDLSIHERLHANNQCKKPRDTSICAHDAKAMSLKARNALRETKQRGMRFVPGRPQPTNMTYPIYPAPQQRSPVSAQLPSTRVRHVSHKENKPRTRRAPMEFMQEMLRLSLGTGETYENVRTPAKPMRKTRRPALTCKSPCEGSPERSPPASPCNDSEAGASPQQSSWGLRMLIPKLKIPMQYISDVITTGGRSGTPRAGKTDYMEYFAHYSKDENAIHH